ncbi:MULTISPECIES: hypothetical protein [Polaromonas]|uniref:Uncharacterized protein n=1 Tax=Polaromonas aquatica TaxID=332657 RepID=A0ABW1U0F9_9BURK
MTTRIDKELTSEDYQQKADFRQNYVPGPAMAVDGPNRHWLLDSPAGRDLLKMKLLKLDHRAEVSLWGEGHEVDGHLNRMVDELNLRELAKPELPMDVLKVNFKLVKMMAAVQFGLS